jgi:hypothetical protein
VTFNAMSFSRFLMIFFVYQLFLAALVVKVDAATLSKSENKFLGIILIFVLCMGPLAIFIQLNRSLLCQARAAPPKKRKFPLRKSQLDVAMPSELGGVGAEVATTQALSGLEIDLEPAASSSENSTGTRERASSLDGKPLEGFV